MSPIQPHLARIALLLGLFFLPLAQVADRASAEAIEIAVDLENPAQRIDGFGASTAWFADNLAKLEPSTRDELFGFLFSPEGLGLDILRVRISPSGSPGPGQGYNWAEPDIAAAGQVIAYLQKTYKLRVMAVPWTAPAWMKDSGEVKGGGFLKPEHYAAYAMYLADWVEGMRREFGIEIDILSVQNEPGRKRWEAMQWTPDQFITFTRDHLIPTLERRGIEVRLMLNEETGWRPHRMLNRLLADPVLAQEVDIAAAHAYNNSFLDPRPIAAAQKLGKPVWMTEHYLGGYAVKHIKDPMRRVLAVGQIIDRFFDRAEVNAYLFWWAVSPPDKGVQGLLGVRLDDDPIDAFTTRKHAYILGHFSRFVHPGWHRVPTTVPDGPDEDFYGLAATAFVGPEGDLSIALINSSDRQKVVRLGLADHPHNALPWSAWITDTQRKLQPVGAGVDPTAIEVPALSIVTVTRSSAVEPD